MSLFADLCYEAFAARSGRTSRCASGAAVGTIAGIGKAIGHGLRYASAAIADRAQRDGSLAIAGYATNLVAVPRLALAGSCRCGDRRRIRGADNL